MTAFSVLRACSAALALICCGSIAHAQYTPSPTPTADALAAQMRVLGSNPRDVYALIAAGDLSTRLGDPAAALAFFGRAQAIEQGNMKVAAGKASALVLLERPGEALRLFDQAERAGVVMDPYLQQRGLAYDLIGQPGYAQRDYRRSLTIAPDDETVRRLALSLGISGQRDEAAALLDPLLRRSDRAAWRARACILAIAGDAGGAQRIATSMIPGGSGLSPFFSRLQWLSPADRAFAVHFGELKPSIARTNDARLAPVLAPLPTAPAPVPVTAPVRVTERQAPARESKSRKRRPGREPMVAARAPTPAPSVRFAPGVTLASSSEAPKPAAEPPATVTQAVALASNSVAALPPVVAQASPSAPPAPSAPKRDTAWAITADTPAVPVTAVPVATAAAVPEPGAKIPATTTAAVSAQVEPVASAAAVPARVETIIINAPRPQVTEVAAVPPPTAPAPTPVVASAPTPMVEAAPPVRTPTVARRNTDLLASIVSSISVPASELEVAPMRKLAVKAPEPKKIDAKKPEAKKPDPKPDPAKGEPARWWAQVAGGANAADLGKDWKRLSAKSPAAFRGTSAWTTPLRATNRLLAGPFKTQGEAMSFVNAVAKDGASAFAWQSEAGQKISKLDSR